MNYVYDIVLITIALSLSLASNGLTMAPLIFLVLVALMLSLFTASHVGVPVSLNEGLKLAGLSDLLICASSLGLLSALG